MCGIAGWFGPEESGNAEALRKALASRGPDGSGVWQGEGATLVHTRLAILDLSDAGAQPMEWEEVLTAKPQSSPRNAEISDQISDGPSTSALRPPTSVLVFNGEIYNFRELRQELEAVGERFSSDSDTEVLLRLLVRDGEACLPRLAGMFAFAFWNEASGEGLLARDGLGIKPLYYRQDLGALRFASEARVLRQPGDPVDADALRDYFLWGSVPEPATLVESVRQLPAGHLLRWKGGKCEVEYWVRNQRPETRLQNQENSPRQRLLEAETGLGARRSSDVLERDAPATLHQDSPTSHHPRSSASIGGSKSSAVAVTRAALEKSIRRHLVADVPVGIFLSGGIDSTVVLALCRQALGPEADIRTFSIGFDDPAFDESSLARLTAEHFGARHTEWKMTPEEGAAEIPAFLESMDQPTIDGFNTWCVSKLARREGMKVVLSGLGGDEFFAGYGSFIRVPRFRRLHRLLGPLRPLAAAVLERKPAGSPWRRLAAFLRSDGSWLAAYHAQRGVFTPDEADQLAESLTGKSPIKPAFVDSLPSISSSRAAKSLYGTDSRLPTSDLRSPSSDPAIVSHLEVTRYMRNQLLRDSDVFAMAHGLELRVPLVDARLAETLLFLPPEERLRQGKQLLIDAVPEIPEWVRNQPKRGFRFPFQQWMEGQFGELLAEAKAASPVPLNAWYRTWAVAAALRLVDGGAQSFAARESNRGAA